MDLNTVKLSLVKYRMTKLELLIPTISEPYEVPDTLISNITMDFDYENYIMPYFEMNIFVPPKIYRAMKKNNLNLKTHVHLQKGYFKNATFEKGDEPIFTDFINDTFYIFMEDMTPDITETKQKLIEKSGYNYNDLSYVKLLIYNQNYYDNMRNIVNAVLTSATLVDALSFVLNKGGINKVLLSPPTNYKKYSEFKITPIPLFHQLDRICNEYGMHKTGTLIYFGLKTLYIIDKDMKCTAYQNNEYKTTHLISCPVNAEESIIQGGCYKNSVDKYNLINMKAKSIQIKSLEELNNNAYGNNFITIDSKTGSVTKSTLDSRKNPKKVLISNYGDDTVSALENELYKNRVLFTFSSSSVDLDMLTPNKQFIITIDDSNLKKYTGKYRLVRTLAMFIKEGDYFDVIVTSGFKG